MSLALPPSHEDPFVGLADPPELTDDGGEQERSRMSGSGFWHRFRRQRFAIAGLAFLVLVTVVAIFAPLIAPFPPNLQMRIGSAPTTSAATS
jgi:ABC-type dipeptide/oligopeptide/nickel transport system permease subunit